jgi:hypothetical protein
MNKAIIGSLLVLAAATPSVAFAGDGGVRIEARGGIAWNGGSEERLGVAVGYDHNFKGGFVGITQSIDTNSGFDGSEISTAIRAGASVSTSGKLFGLVGFNITNWNNAELLVGAGYEHSLGEKTYAGIQYNRLLKKDVNRILMSVGYRF